MPWYSQRINFGDLLIIFTPKIMVNIDDAIDAISSGMALNTIRMPPNNKATIPSNSTRNPRDF